MRSLIEVNNLQMRSRQIRTVEHDMTLNNIRHRIALIGLMNNNDTVSKITY